MIENAWRLLTSTNEWVRFADIKAGATLAGAGVLGALLAQAGLTEGALDSNAAVVLAILSAAAAAVAAVLALFALVPILRVSEHVSLLFFDHVAWDYKADSDGHFAELKDLLSRDDELLRQLAAQIWANSVVARSKFLYSGWAVMALGVGVLLAAVSVAFEVFST